MVTKPVNPVPRARINAPRVRALDRSRLEDVGARLDEHRLALVVAPAGFGKTTLLAQLASAWEGPVAWYRADAGDTTASAVLGHLESTLRSAIAVGSSDAPWSSAEEACVALDRYEGPGALVVIDDLHAVYDTAAEKVLERLIDNLPPSVTVVAATRRPPGFNLSRLRVSGDVLELGPDDLRFRPWEVEALFRDFYREPLLPEELATLARRTEGWAAGLQLFHLATRGKPAPERRRVLEALNTRVRLVRDYLTANVIDDLPRDLRRFLLDTCVLGRLTPELCDQQRGTNDSAVWLAELDEQQIFTHALDEDGSYRYHEVLRSHLEALLVEDSGDAAAREQYQRAAGLLEAAGFVSEALRAYCRAEEWAAVSRLAVGGAERPIADEAGWLELLPARLVDQDPWLMLASARRHLADGDWHAAHRRYGQAETTFGPGSGAEIVRRERQAVSAWLQAIPVPPADWTGVTRIATSRDPQAARHRAAGLAGATGLLATGLAALIAGSVRDARLCLGAAAQRSDASDVVVAAAEIGAAVAGLLAGESAVETGIEDASDRADRLGLGSLAWVGRAAARIDPIVVAAGTSTGTVVGDWGVAIDRLMTSLGELKRGDAPVAASEEAAAAFRRLGAGAFEAWARAGHALAAARSGEPDARDVALGAGSFARSTGVPGALGLAYAALAEADPARAGEYHALRRGIEEESGLDLASFAPAARTVPGYQAFGPGAPVSGAFVGRARELAELRARVDGACSGRGGVVDIDGESGIGKTRLAEEVGMYAAERGANVLWGRGMEGGPGFWPWAQILRAHLLGHDLDRLQRDINGDARALQLVVPELEELLAPPPGSARDRAAMSRFAVFRAIMAVLERAAARSPLVLILDDVHWADASSAALFQYVAKQVRELPVLLVATRRGSAAAVGEATSAFHLPLSGLSETEVADLLAEIAGRAAPAMLTRAVWEKTDGNPFFVHETAKLLLAEGRFDDPGPVATHQVRAAGGVHDLVAVRTAELSAVAREMLETAAVVGRTFSLSLLERVLDADPETVLAAVSEAVGGGLIVETWADAGQYSFGHALIHEAIYDRLEPARRVRLHRAVGDVIEASAGALIEPRLPELAHHFLRAAGDGDAEKAISFAVQAGEWAIVTGAYDEAVRQCEAGLALLEGAGLSDERKAELLVTLADLRARRASPHDEATAIQLAEEAALLGRRLDRPDLVDRAGAVGVSGRATDATGAGAPEKEAHAPRPPITEDVPPLLIRCFGGFEIAIGGRPIDLASVKPRHRSLLRFLAARGGRAAHREQLVDALWPNETDPKAGTRNLQVAVSSLRRLLEPDAARGAATLLVREGDAYRLALSDGADVDVVELERKAERGRQALGRGDVGAARVWFTQALAAYTGELLPEEGPAEWVVKAREQLRLEAAEVAQATAEIELQRGSAAEAAALGERGLQIDRYRDGLWRLVIAAYEQAGDAAAAARTRRAYDEVLDELGLRT